MEVEVATDSLVSQLDSSVDGMDARHADLDPKFVAKTVLVSLPECGHLCVASECLCIVTSEGREAQSRQED